MLTFSGLSDNHSFSSQFYGLAIWVGLSWAILLLVSVGPHSYVIGQRQVGLGETSDGMAVLCSMLSHIFQEFSPPWILVLGA